MDFKTLILQFLNNNDSTINVLNQEQITVMELLFKGGFMMVPILVLFVITIYILIEKILIINRESKSPKGFTDEIISRVKNDDIKLFFFEPIPSNLFNVFEIICFLIPFNPE